MLLNIISNNFTSNSANFFVAINDRSPMSLHFATNVITPVVYYDYTLHLCYCVVYNKKDAIKSFILNTSVTYAKASNSYSKVAYNMPMSIASANFNNVNDYDNYKHNIIYNHSFNIQNKIGNIIVNNEYIKALQKKLVTYTN